MEDSIKNGCKSGLIEPHKLNTKIHSMKKSDEWIEIEGIGRFKGLEIVSEEHQDVNEITINLKYDVWDKNVL